MARTIQTIVAIIATGAFLAQPASVSAYPPGDASFQLVWERTDRPVAGGQDNRSWIWGPAAHSAPALEPYLDSPGGERKVQYFDKSRMEINDLQSDSESLWYVTNGLLARELITGEMQIGDVRFEVRSPADVHVAGDVRPDTPTYATLGQTLDEPAIPVGAAIRSRLDRTGELVLDPDLETHGVIAEYYVSETDRVIASVFWSFMTSTGAIYEEGRIRQGPLFDDPFFAVGLPITNAYWVHVPVSGLWQDVLVQCFERRCLTYTPDNPEGWQVEAGNIGQHYYIWRYGESPPSSPFAPGGAGSFGDGHHHIGTDVQPGIYFADVPSGFCYWERVGLDSNQNHSVIERRAGRDRMLVIIRAGDVAFSTSRCGQWTPLTRVERADIRAPFGAGTFLTGYEIAAGTWQNTAEGSGCFWRSISYPDRPSEGSDQFYFGEAGIDAPVDRNDLAFVSRQCGNWHRIGP